MPKEDHKMEVWEMNRRKMELGYHFDQIAELTGIPQSTLQKIFNGITKRPRKKAQDALFRVLWPGESWMMRDEWLENMRSMRERLQSAAGEGSGAEGQPGALMLGEAAPAYSMKRQGEYTVEDYLALPDERHVELIDGVLYDMAAPTVEHQLIIAEILKDLSNFIDKNKGPCIALPAPVDVQLDCDDYTMIQPDVIVNCDRSKFQNGRLFGAPDFAVEVLSPSNRKKDMLIKADKYRRAGVREFWLVDPKKEKLIVYRFDQDDPIAIYGFGDRIPVGIYDGKCQVDFSAIREKLKQLQDTNLFVSYSQGAEPRPVPPQNVQ